MMWSQTGWRRRVATYALCAGAGYYGTPSSLPFPPLAARALLASENSLSRRFARLAS